MRLLNNTKSRLPHILTKTFSLCFLVFLKRIEHLVNSHVRKDAIKRECSTLIPNLIRIQYLHNVDGFNINSNIGGRKLKEGKRMLRIIGV